MQGAILYGPGDVRFEDRAAPTILAPTDAIIRIAATCVADRTFGRTGAWNPTPSRHRWDTNIAASSKRSAARSSQSSPASSSSARSSPPTTPVRIAVLDTRHRASAGSSSGEAPLLRVPLADGTLVATPGIPSDDLIPSVLALSDVMGTGWFAADAANVRPGATAIVVGDGAVGLLGVLSAKLKGAERIIAMSRHGTRQKLAGEFGATDIVTERGDEGGARIKDITNGIGADSVLECVGTEESMKQAIRSIRPGGSVGYVGVPHGVELKGEELFFAHVHLHGGPAPVRRYLPELIKQVWDRKIEPGKVFDLTLPLEQVAEAYRSMNERRAIKTLLRTIVRGRPQWPRG
jgi:threonine dehydrogenase-like Zn-dependent dehydrogenase